MGMMEDDEFFRSVDGVFGFEAEMLGRVGESGHAIPEIELLCFDDDKSCSGM